MMKNQTLKCAYSMGYMVKIIFLYIGSQYLDILIHAVLENDSYR